MSKKKATMTLKDFHGGSIPPDLALPSAPGVTVRPMDRGPFDRNTSWGNPMGRTADTRYLRPASASSVRNIDDKNLFSHIGRNFDEDERKPLDGGSGPRRMVSDEVTSHQPVRLSNARVVVSQQSSFPVSQVSSGSVGVGSNQSGGRGYPNAWGVRKEVVSVKEARPAVWSAPDPVTKLVHASALEQVSSGRWNSRQSVPPVKDVEVSNVYNKSSYNRLDVVANTEYHVVSPVNNQIHVERGLAVSDGVPSYDRGKASVRVESNERNPSVNVNESWLTRPTGVALTLPVEASEQPKLNLHPRSKPLGNSEGYKESSDRLKLEDRHEVVEHANRTVERPKLNLKPRSSSLDPLEGNPEAKRGTVFGGARPRELVLKERGVEDLPIKNYESQSPSRVKEDPPKVEPGPVDQRTAKYTDRRDKQLDVERTESQRKNWRNDVRRENNTEKNRSQPQHDRPPSPETWRKPVEPVTPASPDASGLRYGKATSAVELAQAFSKSVTGPKVADRVSGSRQIPFSRLTGPSPRPQMSRINGY